MTFRTARGARNQSSHGLLPMTGVAPLVLWAVLAGGLTTQRDPNVGPHLIALEFRGPSVAFAEHPYRCGPDRASRDMLWGAVQSNEAESDGDAVVYEGVLQRITEQMYCGASTQATPARRAALAPPSCRATLSGAADVKVRLKIYRQGARLQGAWVVLTPIDATAHVAGNCRSGEMREMRRAYAERTTIEIQTPPDRLMPGRYSAAVVSPSTARWILHVAPASVAPSS